MSKALDPTFKSTAAKVTAMDDWRRDRYGGAGAVSMPTDNDAFRLSKDSKKWLKKQNEQIRERERKERAKRLKKRQSLFTPTSSARSGPRPRGPSGSLSVRAGAREQRKRQSLFAPTMSTRARSRSPMQKAPVGSQSVRASGTKLRSSQYWSTARSGDRVPALSRPMSRGNFGASERGNSLSSQRSPASARASASSSGNGGTDTPSQRSARGGKNKEGLDYARLRRSLFELADNWTDSIDALKYAAFLFRVHSRITNIRRSADESGRTRVSTAWKDLDDVIVLPTEEIGKPVYEVLAELLNSMAVSVKGEEKAARRWEAKYQKRQNNLFDKVLAPAFRQLSSEDKHPDDSTGHELLHALQRCGKNLRLNKIVDSKTKETMLHIAVKVGYEAGATVLINRGAMLDAKDGGLNTPLITGVKTLIAKLKAGVVGSSIEKLDLVIELLVDNHADPTLRNRSGECALDLAKAAAEDIDLEDYFRPLVEKLSVEVKSSHNRLMDAIQKGGGMKRLRRRSLLVVNTAAPTVGSPLQSPKLGSPKLGSPKRPRARRTTSLDMSWQGRDATMYAISKGAAGKLKKTRRGEELRKDGGAEEGKSALASPKGSHGRKASWAGREATLYAIANGAGSLKPNQRPPRAAQSKPASSPPPTSSVPTSSVATAAASERRGSGTRQRRTPSWTGREATLYAIANGVAKLKQAPAKPVAGVKKGRRESVTVARASDLLKLRTGTGATAGDGKASGSPLTRSIGGRNATLYAIQNGAGVKGLKKSRGRRDSVAFARASTLLAIKSDKKGKTVGSRLKPRMPRTQSALTGIPESRASQSRAQKSNMTRAASSIMAKEPRAPGTVTPRQANTPRFAAQRGGGRSRASSSYSTRRPKQRSSLLPSIDGKSGAGRPAKSLSRSPNRVRIGVSKAGGMAGIRVPRRSRSPASRVNRVRPSTALRLPRRADQRNRSVSPRPALPGRREPSSARGSMPLSARSARGNPLRRSPQQSGGRGFAPVVSRPGTSNSSAGGRTTGSRGGSRR